MQPLDPKEIKTVQQYLVMGDSVEPTDEHGECNKNTCTLVEHMTDRELLQELVTGQRQLIKALSEFQLPPMLETMFGSLFKR